MLGRIGRIAWYGTLFGIAVIIFERVTGGITGGLKKGLSGAVGL